VSANSYIHDVMMCFTFSAYWSCNYYPPHYLHVDYPSSFPTFQSSSQWNVTNSNHVKQDIILTWSALAMVF